MKDRGFWYNYAWVPADAAVAPELVHIQVEEAHNHAVTKQAAHEVLGLECRFVLFVLPFCLHNLAAKRDVRS